MPESRTKKKKMVNSFVWTDEEAKYLKAVLKWKEKENLSSHSDDDKGGLLLSDHSDMTTASEKHRQTQQEEQKPAGEFRILVIGAKGTGKTSILTRFASGQFPGEGEPPDPFYERGCRHRIELDSSAYSFSLPGQGQAQMAATTAHSPGAQSTTATQTYVVDALEMPSKHLASDPMLEQALNITEAGVLVYDVSDPKSLQLVIGIAEFVKEYLDNVNAKYQAQTQIAPGGSNTNAYPRRREFPLILVGNKCDVDEASSNNESSGERERLISWADGSKAAAKITTIGNINNNSNSRSVNGAILSPSINPQGPVPFVEVSAKTGTNIEVIFPRLARDILRYRWLVEQKLQREQRQQQQQLVLLRQREMMGTQGQGYRGVGGVTNQLLLSSSFNRNGNGKGKELGYDDSFASAGGGSGNNKGGRSRFWRRVVAGGCFRRR